MHSSPNPHEAFQFCFLERLLKIADVDQFVLKDSVNLRFFFGSPRLSEDMDLDVLAGTVPTLKKNGYKVLDDAAFRRTLRMYGIADLEVNDPDKATHTPTTQRFRVLLVTTSGEKLPSRVEFSRRATEVDGGEIEIAEIDSEIAHRFKRPSFRCQHYSGGAAGTQKVLALAGHAVTHARDVFDLEILHRGGHLQGTNLRSVVGRQACRAAVENLKALNFDDFSGQVLEYLDDAARREFGNRALWSAIVDRVRQTLTD